MYFFILLKRVERAVGEILVVFCPYFVQSEAFTNPNSVKVFKNKTK